MDGPGLAQHGPEQRGISVDVIVPVRNEVDNIEPFLATLAALPTPPEVALSVIFVEDGSSDGTVELLRALSRADPAVRYYSVERGFGEGPAIVFGLSRSEADAMIMMAVESHPPELIPAMIQGFQRGAQVVQCIRDSFSGRDQRRDAMTALFPMIVRLLTGSEYGDQNVYYRLVSREFSRRILESPHFWRFIRFPLPDRASGALEVVHADMLERDRGESEYGIVRLAGLGVDGILAWISKTRLSAMMLASAALAGWLIASGFTALALLLLTLSGGIAARFIQLRNVDYIQEMTVTESSDAPREQATRS